jgi:predicted nucleotidyltransferase
MTEVYCAMLFRRHGVDLMEKEYRALAKEMVQKLKKDPNIIAVLVYGSVATHTLSEGSDIDLLLIVKDIPEDVDMFGVKRTSIDGVPVDLAHRIREQIESQIDYEAGSWYSSSIMLNSEILYDPKGVAADLRKRILDMPAERKEFIYNCLMEDARTYVGKVHQCVELGDLRGAVYLMRLVCENLVQVLFIANETRPSSEKGMIRDFLTLKRLPKNFVESYDLIQGFDRFDEQRTSQMIESFEELLKKTEDFWAEVKQR